MIQVAASKLLFEAFSSSYTSSNHHCMKLLAGSLDGTLTARGSYRFSVVFATTCRLFR